MFDDVIVTQRAGRSQRLPVHVCNIPMSTFMRRIADNFRQLAISYSAKFYTYCNAVFTIILAESAAGLKCYKQ